MEVTVFEVYIRPGTKALIDSYGMPFAERV